MLKRRLWIFISTLWLCSSQFALANNDPAVEQLEIIIDHMTTTLDEQQLAIKQDPNIIVDIVNEIIVPHVDFNIMTKSVLARHWNKATPDQRARFQEVFTQWVILTYAAAFLNYDGEKVIFGKTRSLGKRGDREEIFTFIVQKNDKRIPVNYRMVKSGSDSWKAYDINVENVSLVSSFRTQVDGEINRKGVETVIQDLQERNKNGLTQVK